MPFRSVSAHMASSIYSSQCVYVLWWTVKEWTLLGSLYTGEVDLILTKPRFTDISIPYMAPSIVPALVVNCWASIENCTQLGRFVLLADEDVASQEGQHYMASPSPTSCVLNPDYIIIFIITIMRDQHARLDRSMVVNLPFRSHTHNSQFDGRFDSRIRLSTETNNDHRRRI